MNRPIVVDADDLDLDQLGINHKEPTQEEIYELLWGVAHGQPIPLSEFDAATVGEPLNE